MTERRMTPLMGWASWNCFRTDISEEKIKAQADALVSSGLAECGYCYVNIDDGFFGGRNEKGELLFHKQRFPNGMRPVADYIHSLGLKAGIYTDAGDNTCGYYYDNEREGGFAAGCYGHEKEDLWKLLVENDFDFIKADWCGGLRLALDEEEQYTKIGKIVEDIRRKTGKPVVYNICRWEFPGEWAVRVADSWRTGLDIEPHFDSVLYQIDKMKPLARFCGPGHVNDSDMMQIGNGMSWEEDQSHFAMWCMLSTPLMTGCDLTKLSGRTLELLKNKELIALNQDAAVKQAVVAREYRNRNGKLTAEAWVKELSDKHTKAVALFNRSDSEKQLEFDFRQAGLLGDILTVRELCTHQNQEPAGILRVTLPAHGTRVFAVKSSRTGAFRDCHAGAKIGREKFAKLTEEEMKKLMQEGALLLDVRTKEEYDRYHLKGAVSMPYCGIYLHAAQLLPDKTRPLIVCCATGRKSCMAKERLDDMGYEHVYYRGGIL